MVICIYNDGTLITCIYEPLDAVTSLTLLLNGYISYIVSSSIEIRNTSFLGLSRNTQKPSSNYRTKSFFQTEFFSDLNPKSIFSKKNL